MVLKSSRRQYVTRGAWVGTGLAAWGYIVYGLDTYVSTAASLTFFCVSVGAAIGYILHWVDENL